jgi:hypothetical protein
MGIVGTFQTRSNLGRRNNFGTVVGTTLERTRDRDRDRDRKRTPLQSPKSSSSYRARTRRLEIGSRATRRTRCRV